MSGHSGQREIWSSTGHSHFLSAAKQIQPWSLNVIHLEVTYAELQIFQLPVSLREAFGQKDVPLQENTAHCKSAANEVSLLRKHRSHSPGQLFSLFLVEAEDGWSRLSLSKAGQIIQQWWLLCNFEWLNLHAACSMRITLTLDP